MSVRTPLSHIEELSVNFTPVHLTSLDSQMHPAKSQEHTVYDPVSFYLRCFPRGWGAPPRSFQTQVLSPAPDTHPSVVVKGAHLRDVCAPQQLSRISARVNVILVPPSSHSSRHLDPPRRPPDRRPHNTESRDAAVGTPGAPRKGLTSRRL